MVQVKKSDLLFLPLGGSNEIGMNVNLYHYNGKWLIVDLGAGFAGDEFPGISMLAPDLRFVYKNRDKFLGIVLTHAHEDHLGSVGCLWDKLRLPIYATPFAAGLALHKLKDKGFAKKAEIIEVKPNSEFAIGDFQIKMVQITHSVPEMNGLVIKTPKGNIFHTGDWKFDPDPVVGDKTDMQALKQIGDEGVLAMVCDSTNVFNDRFSGSEGVIEDSIFKLINNRKGMVAIATFASNVARIASIAKAAKRAGRKPVLAGFSLNRITQIAKDCGYLKDVPKFESDKNIRDIPRHKLLVIATGCQGEPNASMMKIATGQHRYIRINKSDLVIFSSKIIPGNEKKIFKLFNMFARQGVEVITEKDHQVHVSGHPSSEELRKMYELIRPKIAIPVHGEPVHLQHHARLSEEVGVEHSYQIQNGEMIHLCKEGGAKHVANVHYGYLGVDGSLLHPKDGEVMMMRRKMMEGGIFIVTLFMDGKGGLLLEPQLYAPGVLDFHAHKNWIGLVQREISAVIDSLRNISWQKIQRSVTRRLEDLLEEKTGNSNTLIQVNIVNYETEQAP